MKISKTLSVAFVALVAALMVTMGWSIGPVSAARGHAIERGVIAGGSA
jgi:hypothetical protein